MAKTTVSSSANAPRQEPGVSGPRAFTPGAAAAPALSVPEPRLSAIASIPSAAGRQPAATSVVDAPPADPANGEPVNEFLRGCWCG